MSDFKVKIAFLLVVIKKKICSTYSKVPVIHEVDIPVGSFSLRGRCQIKIFVASLTITNTNPRKKSGQSTFGIQSFLILPPCGTFEQTCNTFPCNYDIKKWDARPLTHSCAPSSSPNSYLLLFTLGEFF